MHKDLKTITEEFNRLASTMSAIYHKIAKQRMYMKGSIDYINKGTLRNCTVTIDGIGSDMPARIAIPVSSLKTNGHLQERDIVMCSLYDNGQDIIVEYLISDKDSLIEEGEDGEYDFGELSSSNSNFPIHFT